MTPAPGVGAGRIRRAASRHDRRRAARSARHPGPARPATTPSPSGGSFDPAGFVAYRQAPPVNLEDPQVRLIDLDGDGVIDALRRALGCELYYNDPDTGWLTTRDPPSARPAPARRLPRPAYQAGGHDRRRPAATSSCSTTATSPTGPISATAGGHAGHDGQPPQFADAAATARPATTRGACCSATSTATAAPTSSTSATGRSPCGSTSPGDSFADPGRHPRHPGGHRQRRGPPRRHPGHRHRRCPVQLRRRHGPRRPATSSSTSPAASSPYLLTAIDNHHGATTTIEYAPSTRYYLEDRTSRARDGEPPCPFPVQVVARDTRRPTTSPAPPLTTEYRYHHGYWDGARAGVPRLRARRSARHELDRRPRAGATGSPPTETRTWFHPGPVGPGHGDWPRTRPERRVLGRGPAALGAMAGVPPAGLPRRALRDAIRALRGHVLRTELYALDGTGRRARPYTVTEHTYGLREESPRRTGRGSRPVAHLLPACGRRAHHAVGARQRPDDSVHLHRRLRPLRPAALAHRSSPCPAAATTETAFTAATGEPYLAAHDTGTPRSATTPTATSSTASRRTTSSRSSTMAARRCATLQAASRRGRALALRVIGQQRALLRRRGVRGPAARPARRPRRAHPDRPPDPHRRDIIHGRLPQRRQVLSPPGHRPTWPPAALPAWTAEYPQAFRDGAARHGPVTSIDRAAWDRISRLATSAPDDIATTSRRARATYPADSSPPRATRSATTPRSPTTSSTCCRSDTTDPAGLTNARRLRLPRAQPEPGHRPQRQPHRLGHVLRRWACSPRTAVMGRKTERRRHTGAPGTRMIYDLLAFAERGRSRSRSARIRRVHHDTDLDVPQRARPDDRDGGVLGRVRPAAADPRAGRGHRSSATRPSATRRARRPGPRRTAMPPGAPVGAAGRRQRGRRPAGRSTTTRARWCEKYEPFFSEGWDYAPPRRRPARAAR